MKKKFNSKRLLPILFALPLATVFPLSSCGLATKWDWMVSTKENTVINYCLLIGQNDHTDSQMRTHGTRQALKTLDTEAAKKDGYNANIAKPVQGKLTLHYEGSEESLISQEFTVNEIEHMEQKSIGGAAWDPITANATASTWIAKHGSNITFFVSNNDAMAEGAYWASNWIKGLPIFGYDANSTTLQWIKNGAITGTVDQSPSNQCAASMMLLRKLYDEKINLWSQTEYHPEEGKFGSSTYDPTETGFNDDYVDAQGHNFGHVNKGAEYFTYRKDRKHVDKSEGGKILDNNEILSKSTAITDMRNTAMYLTKDITDINSYIKEDGKTAKEPRDMFNDNVAIVQQTPSGVQPLRICHTYSNKSEAFLVATMRPYFNEYARRLGISPDIIEGDGTDETQVLNQIRARQDEYPGGFLICPAKTTSGLQYVLDLAERTYQYEAKNIKVKKENYLRSLEKFPDDYKWEWNKDPNWHGWENFEERLDTPIIFWIREPFKPNGQIDDTVLKLNKYFKYAYYVGSDSANAGEVQGRLIVSVISRWYTDSLKESKK